MFVVQNEVSREEGAEVCCPKSSATARKVQRASCVIAAAGSVCAVSLSTGGCGQSDRVSPHTVLGCLWWTRESLEDNT